MNSVDERIESLQKELDALKAAREAEKKPQQQQKKKIDWSKVPVDTPISAGIGWKRHFKKLENNGYLSCWTEGSTSYSTTSLYDSDSWKNGDVVINFDACEWKPWFGGKNPIPDGVLVDVIYRDTTRHNKCAPHNFCWPHHTSNSDIIAYRMVGLQEGWEF